MNESVGDEQTATRPLRAGLTAAGLPDAVAVDPVSLGNRKQTYVVSEASDTVQRQHSRRQERAGGPVVVQISDKRTALRTEAALLDQIAAATTVPVPEVRASGTVDEGAYLVTDRIEGENLHYRFGSLDSPTQRELVSTFGRHLATLHDQFTFEGVGQLQIGDGTLRPTAETDWQSWFTTYATEAIERLPAEFDDRRADLRAVIDAATLEANPPISLFPWDYRPGNTLGRDGSLVAILDWEQPIAGAPALSVAKAEYLIADWYVEEPEPLRTAFREGYASVRGLPEIRPPHRVAAIASSAVDSRGAVTNPRYPELRRDESIKVHSSALDAVR